MQRQDVDVPDAADAVAVTLWGRQMGEAVAAANVRRIRLQQIGSVLGSAGVIDLRTRLQAATAALAAAQAAADAAAAASQAAQATLLDFTRTTYADAENALAAATKAVGDELGRLMATATTSAAVTSTIDGLGLRERYRTGTATDPPVWDAATIPFRAHPADLPFDPEIRLPAVDDADAAALLAVLADLDDTVDAVADVVAAESVHHLVAGNLVRSGAALAIAASGTVTDEPDVIDTPAPGHDLTHRVLVLTDTEPVPGWHGSSASLVATADPVYASWLAGLLPDPATVLVGAAALADDGSVLARVAFPGDAIGLDAAGWLRVTGDTGELVARVALAARPLLSAALGSPWTGRIVLDVPESPPDRVSPAAMGAVCARLRAVMTTARALTPADLAGAGVDPSAPATGIAAAAVSAVQRVQDALTALDDDLARAATMTPDELTTALLAACDAGLAEATPPAASGVSDPGTLVALAAAARSRLASRLAIPAFAADPAGPQVTLDAARALLPKLCAAPVPLMSAVAAPADPLVRADLADSAEPLPDATAPAIRDWLADHARVRPALSALLDAHDAADALAAATRLRPRASQLPREPVSRWAGTDPAPTSGLVDLVVLKHGVRTSNGQLSGQVAGLAVDTWVQTVPAATRDTAVAFHYDEPRTDPPQSILVAVGADLGADHGPGTWALGDLVGVVTSTMALARQRAIAADLVDDASVQIGVQP
ncbi:MAG TPA: hypothetical protein VIM10_05340 [Actinopolymorphaceae bacterium]|jgi:hypothetical protein